jgi:F0F1-type ATP synthase assembly protein I
VLTSPAFGLLGMGFALVFWTVGGVMLGRWLDGRWGTEPVFTLALLLAGLMIGFYSAYRRIREIMQRTGRSRR